MGKLAGRITLVNITSLLAPKACINLILSSSTDRNPCSILIIVTIMDTCGHNDNRWLTIPQPDNENGAQSYFGRCIQNHQVASATRDKYKRHTA